MIELSVLLSWADSMELASLLTKQTVVTSTKKHFSYFVVALQYKACTDLVLPKPEVGGGSNIWDSDPSYYFQLVISLEQGTQDCGN